MLATRLLVSHMDWFMDMESSSMGKGATQFLITEVTMLPRALRKLSCRQGLLIAQGFRGESTRACWWKLMDSWVPVKLPVTEVVQLFRRLSRFSEREELRPDLDTLSTLSRASLRNFSALS